MKRILRLIVNRWTLSVVGLIAASLLIWWVGPTVAIAGFVPFESEWSRWLLIALLVLAVLGPPLVRALRARRASRALAAGLVRQEQPSPEARPDLSAVEVQALRQRFEEALGLLRKRRFGGEAPSLWARIRTLGSRQYLYELPWYVFIGAPGAGKTTALLNSGLRFPLASRLGPDAVRGVGGTRDCDWWFTEEAVFLDTAGRYTTQQSHQEVDAGAWKGFLQLLKKTRPRRPINGVILTLSAADLLQQSPAEREAHTQALRARVRELYEDLGVRLPIYVLVTKADLLAGFGEFFGALGKEEREQVWGVSFPAGAAGLAPAAFAAELERLERRLYGRLADRLEEERDPARRAALYGFPQQFAQLRGRLVEFVDATFAPTRFEATALVRGVYLASGTQEGSPIDRVMGAVARGLGLERKLLPAQYPSGRSYFLTRLLRDVVFAEAGLAGLDMRGERRRQLMRLGAMVAAGAAVVLMTAIWWISYWQNRAYLAEVGAQLAEVRKEVAQTQPGARAELSELLPTLTSVRTLAETRATPDGNVPWSWRFGLYQGGKLEAASQATYRRILRETLLPSLATHLERRLRQAVGSDRGDSYDTLKTYIMLYDPKHFHRETVWRWYEARIEELLPGARPEDQKALKGHFEMLYARGWVEPAVVRDDALLAQARSVVGRDSLAKRVYERLKRDAPVDAREFTITDKAGPKAMLAFVRASREPLTKGVPGLYTKDTYYKYLVKGVDPVALRLGQEEGWVLDTGRSSVVGASSTLSLADAVKRLYLEDYRRIWRQFVNDIVVIKDQDLVRITDVTRTLSGPDSPLRSLVKAIARETTLSIPPETEAGLVGKVTGKAQDLVAKGREAITGVSGEALVKAMVDDQFEDINRLAGPPGGTGPAPVDTIVQQLNEFYQYLVAVNEAFRANAGLPPGESANKMRADAMRLPEPMRTMVLALVEGSARVIAEKVGERDRQQQRLALEKQQQDARLAREKQAEDLRLAREKQADEQRLAREKQAEEQRLAREKHAADIRQLRDRIDVELRAQIADFCVRAVNDRYPILRSSRLDVTPEDFARLFAPSGLLDGFFQKQLAPHVDTGQRVWRFREPLMGQSPALAEFQRAQVIRDVFFRGGGAVPSIQLEFKPIEMDAAIQQFSLDVDGKVVRYAHGPQVPVRVQFPGPGGRGQVRVSISPPPPSGASGITFEGPWALFRMFDEVKIEETNQMERFVAAISVGGRRTVFEILASSVRNPFRLPELSQFRCPTAL